MKLKISMILLMMLGLSLTVSSFRAAAEFGLDSGPLYTDSTECDSLFHATSYELVQLTVPSYGIRLTAFARKVTNRTRWGNSQ